MAKQTEKADLSCVALYAAIFFDLFGFGMIFPDIQLRAEWMGARGWLIGAILASTFAVQLVASPFWGRLSDRLGRKRVLAICAALSASGLFLYGFASAIPLLLLSRIVSGLGGANVAIGQALLADSTSPEQRTAAMGRIGAAASLGLVGGPVVGGFLAHLSRFAVGMSAGASSAFGLLLILALVRSAAPAAAEAPSKKAVFLDLSLLADLPRVRALVLVVSVAWFALASLEGTFGRLIELTLRFDQRQFGVVFGYESLLGFAIQAFFIGAIARRVGDTRLLRGAYLLQGAGLALTPFTYRFPVATGWLAVLLLLSTLYAVGAGLANPTINSLCSKLVPGERQGELFGFLQGARSIGFIAGPIIGGALFDAWFAAPYLLAGLSCLAATALVPAAE